MACKSLIKELRNRTGCSLPDCKHALILCGDKIGVAYTYLKLKNSAVARWKIIDGKKIAWSDFDYVMEAKRQYFSQFKS